jgi:hypothetical protein
LDRTRFSTAAGGAAAAPTDLGTGGGGSRNQDKIAEKKRKAELINAGRFGYRRHDSGMESRKAAKIATGGSAPLV